MNFLVEPEPTEGKSKITGITRSLAMSTSPTSERKLVNQRVGKPIRNKNELSVNEGFELSSDRQPPHVAESYDELIQGSVDGPSYLTEGPEQADERLEKMRGAVRTLIECVGENPNREGLLATPSRYAKALLFFTQGYHLNINEIVNNTLFNDKHNEMVIVKDIEIHSLCEHHLVPFTGKMQIGYMPSDVVIGLSKLACIAEMFSRRLQIQERLTREVAQAITEVVKPKGVIVTVESSHLCMVMRGVQKTNATSVTSCVLGCFETKAELRAQFHGLLGGNRT